MILQASVSRRVLAPILALSTVILLPGWAVSQNREPTVQNVFRAAPRELENEPDDVVLVEPPAEVRGQERGLTGFHGRTGL